MTDRLTELRELTRAATEDADALLAAWSPVVGGDVSPDTLDALNAAIVHAARSLFAVRNALPALLDVAAAAADSTIRDDDEMHVERFSTGSASICNYCGRRWPCPWSILAAALARLDGGDGG